MNDFFKPLISITIPVFNEEANIFNLYERLNALSIKMKDRCNMEFVFSDNHSQDQTWNLLSQLADNDDRVRAIRFTRNFGFQNSILANFLHTKGDAVMQVDADLQDPPEMLEFFFEYWTKGFYVVYGVRAQRPESRLLSTFRNFGYWFIDKLSDHKIPRNVGDFRLIDRKVITLISKIKTPNPYLRGMIASLGLKDIGIPYNRESRYYGESKFNFFGLLRLGFTAVFNHSSVPLRAASFVGVGIISISFLGTFYYIFLKLLHPNLPQGLASIHILVLFGIGLNSFLLGIIGEYLLRIYLVLRAESLVIVEDSLNIPPKELLF